MTGTLASAPAAVAHAPEPTPTSPVLRNMTETGGVQILKKDTGGDLLAGASFSLLDSTGKEVANGKTDAEGTLVFKGLEAGVYRLKETSSGTQIHDVVPDQDVIVTPGNGTPLTVIDPFKPAEVTVKKTDKATGQPLAGAVINITPATGGDPVTLTTGKDGIAKAKLPVSSRNGTKYTATETKAPEGYQLDAKPKDFTAKPGAPETVTVADTKKEEPTPTPTIPPTKPPTTPPVTPTQKPTPDTKPSASTPASATPTPDETASSTTAPTPEGSLAHTGADATPWLLGGAGLLLAAGGGALLVTRRRRTDDADHDGSAES
ncbi:MSCRAMM family protein [Streptomyces albospinus]|uniref:MSCRAMM family protein n=1 Tax=Streptomyces albospinus TaxID=285515 RepID=UPI001E59D8BB|nr:SpaA isopeptide-forming pilin-related protein [Streptomyces albospinus]